jgi:hypothetical protein
MAVGFAQSLREVSTRDIPGIKRCRREAHNLATIFEPIVKTMWDPQHLATL